jgi:hypothetical protein
MGAMEVKRPSTRTAIGRAALKNRVVIDLIGLSFIHLIDDRLASLRQEPPKNSDEARAAIEAAIADYEDLKRRIEAFLGATSEFAVKKVKEKSVVQTTNSLAAGISDWWRNRHLQICDKAFDVGLFGVGVTICVLAGAGGDFAVGVPGALIGRKVVADVISALKSSRA